MRSQGLGFHSLDLRSELFIKGMNGGILQDILDKVKAHRDQRAATPIAVIFDLDSTLFCVSPRSQAILRELGENAEFAREFDKVAAVLRDIEVRSTDWGIREPLLRTGVTVSPEAAGRIRAYWRSRFFASGHLHHDLVYPEAPNFVRGVQALGAEIFYLTGRPEASMREGTLRALSHHGFPLVSDGHLLMKVSDSEADEHFKVVVLREMIERFSHIWFFENEPVIIHDVRRELPSVNVIFVNSVHSGKAEAPTDIVTVVADYRGIK